MTLTAVPGVKVGHWTDPEGLTGVTVVVPPQPNVTAVEVRGAAPGTRETALLAPGMKVQGVHAITLCGGSAFGLAAASGVADALEQDGQGFPTMAGPVPIVPAAVIFDLMVGSNTARPGPGDGAAAYRAATDGPVEMGTVGAGTGATVAGWRGFEHARKGGVGSASAEVGEATVAALAVVNAVGDVFTLEGEPLTGGDPVPGPPPFVPQPLENTTLVVLATDGAFDRAGLQRLCVRAHDALGACLRPGHTRYDGDAVFAVSCGDRTADPDAAGEAAFAVVGRSIEAAVRSATAAGGIPAVEGA
ncbi:MAG: P1 family peptidase [Actinobacteria bacterium]|nr:P1 family peptidase [Actinomycetota bacterium]